MTICHMYATVYDFKQLFFQRLDYLQDPWNAIDQSHIWVGFFNFYTQISGFSESKRRKCHNVMRYREIS